MKATLLLLLLVTAGTPVLADAHRADHRHAQVAGNEPPTIDCETIRSYVIQVGLVQAKAVARASGMTPSQELRALQCLAK